MTTNKRNRYVKDVVLISIFFSHNVVLKLYAMKDKKYGVRDALKPTTSVGGELIHPLKSMLIDQAGFEADINPAFVQLITYMNVSNVDDISETSKASLRDIGYAFHSLEQ